MNVVQCYASTSGKYEDNTNQFYERLKFIVENWPRKDHTILMGGVNDEIKMDNTE